MKFDDDYTDEALSNVTYMPWLQNGDNAVYINYINEVYGTEWPKELYIVGDCIKKDIDTLANQFVTKGWHREDLYKAYRAVLIRLRKIEE